MVSVKASYSLYSYYIVAVRSVNVSKSSLACTLHSLRPTCGCVSSTQYDMLVSVTYVRCPSVIHTKCMCDLTGLFVWCVCGAELANEKHVRCRPIHVTHKSPTSPTSPSSFIYIRRTCDLRPSYMPLAYSLRVDEISSTFRHFSH